MKRALTFVGIFILIAGGVYAMVIGLNYPAFKSLFANADAMNDGNEYIQNTYSLKSLAEFVGNKPEFVSIISYNINNPDSGIFYGVDEPRTLGTLASLFLLIEYERQVSNGELNPDDEVDLNEIDSFLLPQVNENAHKGALVALQEDEETITNDKAISALVQYNSLALFDYFWFKLGEANLANLMDSLALTETELPVPFSGIYSVITPNVFGPSDVSTDNLNQLLQLDRDSLSQLYISVANKFISNNELVIQRTTEMEKERLNLTFIEERDALQLFPRTTAREIASVLERLLQGQIVSKEVSNSVLEKMRWSIDSETIQRSFSDYGAMYENRMGVLSGIDFGTSIYDDHTSVQAVFFDELPVAFWLHMSSNHMQEDFQQRLIWDPALFETTLQEIQD